VRNTHTLNLERVPKQVMLLCCADWQIEIIMMAVYILLVF